ncbi:hypothetical protein EC036_37280 [Enterobacter cloacae]|nr:hypothetical protein EC036_37280 [Enterobacter cloacae]
MGEKSWRRGWLPDAAHCGCPGISSQCTFLPMSCPFLQSTGETSGKYADCEGRKPYPE